MIDFQIQATGLREDMVALEKIVDRLGNVSDGLERATHNVAGVFAQNYASEGGMVGGWPGLADYTLNIREWQGVPPGPILIRYESGGLWSMAVDFFLTARAGSRASAGGSYPFKTWSDQTVNAQLQVGDNRATLSLSGSYKLLNQWGHPNWGQMSDVPARPFWFVNDNVVREAREGVESWIQDEVL